MGAVKIITKKVHYYDNYAQLSANVPKDSTNFLSLTNMGVQVNSLRALIRMRRFNAHAWFLRVRACGFVRVFMKPRSVLPCVRKPSVILEPPEMPRFGQKLLWITLVSYIHDACTLKILV